MFRKLNTLLLLLLFFSAGCTNNRTNDDESVSSESVEAEINPVEFGIDPGVEIPSGLTLGSKAPGFAGRDNQGKSFDLYSNLKEGPVVLMFYRGKWCPVCNRYMSSFNDSVQYILQTGAQVVAITPEIRSNAEEFAAATNTQFPIISDPTNTIMDVYKVTFKVTDEYSGRIQESKGISIAENNGSKEARLPVPATYIIDPSGDITYVHFDLNYRNRATVAEILRHL